MEKCVKVIGDRDADAYKNIVDAAGSCQSTGGRLYSAADCEEVRRLREEMLGAKEVAEGGEFFLGTVAGGMKDAAPGRRRSVNDRDDEIDA